MLNFILNILFSLGGMCLFSYFVYSSINWKELSNKYRSGKKSNIYLHVADEAAYLNKLDMSGMKVGVQALILCSLLMGSWFYKEKFHKI